MNASQETSAIAYNNQHALSVIADVCAAFKVEPRPVQYDAALVNVIAERQQARGLSVDGKVGQRTRELVSTLLQALPAAVLWPPLDASQQVRGEHYLGLCAQLGMTSSLARPLLIAFRGVRPRASETHPVVSARDYDDTFVLLARVNGALTTREFVGATHPYQTVTGAVGTPDVNGDGSPDVGTIKPGHYLLRRQNQSAEHPSLHLVKLDGTEGIPTWRDTNHDARISGPELTPQLFATEVLLHPGFTSLKRDGKPYSSIGCQTAQLADVQAVAQYAEVEYFLLDARATIVQLTTASGLVS